MRLKWSEQKEGRETKSKRWAALCQGSLLDSMTPVFPSSIPDPSAVPTPHPLLTHSHPPSPAAIQKQSTRKASGSHGGPKGLAEPWLLRKPGEKGQNLNGGQGWPEAGNLQGEFHLFIESSQAPTCPVSLTPPPTRMERA